MKTSLCSGNAAAAWYYRSWVQIAALPDKHRFTVVIPVSCFVDYADDLPLDIEELTAMRLLNAALEDSPLLESTLVLPPHRFNPGRTSNCFFTTSTATAHASLRSICSCLHAYGFRKVLFFNSNPHCVDFVDVAGRDLRIELGLQPFCINLNALGLDFSNPDAMARIRAVAGIQPD
jgi:hypothetical protein